MADLAKELPLSCKRSQSSIYNGDYLGAPLLGTPGIWLGLTVGQKYTIYLWFLPMILEICVFHYSNI